MSTPQTIALRAPRFRIRQARLLTALGLLVAIAASIVILELSGANHTGATTPATVSQATSVAVPQVRYLGPRQEHALQTTQTQATGTTMPQYTCLGPAQERCLR
jgi:hypothetical protein